MTSKERADFDWVTAFFSCSPNAVFERLRQEVKKDVEIRNAMRSPHALYTFVFQTNGESFTVFIERNLDHRSVTFNLTKKGIKVVDNKDTQILDAALMLNEEGECRPKINGKEYEFWQLRQMALGDLFIIQ
jgi:hypothetical protein